ncbi:hypothetical protein [Fusibacter sp. JL216-2]|uniref:hypothetical protein n=1 Tax=Fusibacter sp. JL216-2 TaxID=3071453 RepID=UPI003D32AA03
MKDFTFKQEVGTQTDMDSSYTSHVPDDQESVKHHYKALQSSDTKSVEIQSPFDVSDGQHAFADMPQDTTFDIRTPFGYATMSHSPYGDKTFGVYIKELEALQGATSINGTSYLNIINMLFLQSKNSSDIATALLNNDLSFFSQDIPRQAAATLISIIRVAEQWRADGASELWHAVLKLASNGLVNLENLEELKTVFPFIHSADSGRHMIVGLQRAIKTSNYADLPPLYLKLIQELKNTSFADIKVDDKLAVFKNRNKSYKSAMKPRRHATIDSRLRQIPAKVSKKKHSTKSRLRTASDVRATAFSKLPKRKLPPRRNRDLAIDRILRITEDY